MRQARLGVSGDPDRRLAFEGTRALGLALAGHPLDALRVAAGVRRRADGSDLGRMRSDLALAEAMAAREIGDRDRAEPALRTLAERPSYPLSYVQLYAALDLVETSLLDGDTSAAQDLWRQCVSLGRDELPGPAATSRLARTAVAVGLASGDVETAQRWVQRIDDGFWLGLSRARIHLAGAHPAQASEALASIEPRCARHQVVRELVLARAIVDQDRESAAKHVAMAMELAADRGMLQTVAAEGSSLLDLVELGAWRVSEGWLQRLRQAMVPTWDGDFTGGPAGALVQELTDRERDVLRLLPSRLTLREVAAELFVSQNTLKFHLRIIYRKLGVNSRAGAVESARRLHLLSRG